MKGETEMVDTHAHLYLSEFDEDRDAMIQRARNAGVTKAFLPNIDVSSIAPLMNVVEAYPGFCYPMMGLHPCSVKKDFGQQLDQVEALHDTNKYVAIGEIGTDLYWDTTLKEEQESCFRRQLEFAKRRNLPVVIHSRESLDWNIEIVSELQDGSLGGIFHCFTGTAEQAHSIIDLGFYLGIGGVVTFRNSWLADVVKELPLENLVLETDAPYLSPHPYRGKRNESSYIKLVAEKIAECMNMSLQRVCDVTNRNALDVFKMDP